MPRINNKLEHEEVKFRENASGTLVVKGIDTKEVIALNNCNDRCMVEVKKKQKNGTSITVGYAAAISFYRQCVIEWQVSMIWTENP